MVRYSEIINENTAELYVNSERKLKTMLTYNEVNLQNGKLVIDINELTEITFPLGFTVNGNMKIQRRFEDAMIRLSLYGDLTVNGSLDLSGLTLKMMTEKLYVDGDLHLTSSTIEHMPKQLYVGGYVHTSGSNIVMDNEYYNYDKAIPFTGDYSTYRGGYR